MKKFTLKKIVEILLPCIATSVAYAEPPFPPPLQSQDGRTIREGTRTVSPATLSTPASTQALAFDPLKAKARNEPYYSNMVGIPFGSYLLFPEISLTHGYDNNIYAERKNVTTDWITTISPMLVAKSNWERHALNFGVGMDIDSYAYHTTEDVTNYWIGGGGQYDFSANSNVFGNLFQNHKHEDRGSADATPGLYPTQYFSTEANVGAATKAGPFSMRFSVDAEKFDFSTPPGAVTPYSNDDRNRTQFSAVARVGYAVSPTLEPFIQAESDARRYEKILDDYGFMRNSDGHRAALGMAFKPSAALQGEAFVGQMYQRFDDSRFTEIVQPYVGADLTWKPLVGTTASAFFERTLGETTVPGASTTMDNTAGARVEKVINQNTLLNGRVAYTRSDFNDVARTDEIIDAGAGLKHYVTPTVFLGADYRFVNRDSNVLYANYSRNIAMLSMGYTPGRKYMKPDEKTGGGWLDYLDTDTTTEMHSTITPKLYGFTRNSEFNPGSTAFLDRYDYRNDTFGGARDRAGVIADVDLAVVYGDAKRDFIVLERDGFGLNNNRTKLKVDSDAIKFKAYSSNFTSATGGIDFRYNPNAVVGGTDANYLVSTSESTHVAQFNYDSAETLYKVTRRNNGASAEFKPAVFDGNGAVEFSYDGYTRNGNQMTNYVLPNNANNGALAELNQWRGYNRSIDERSNRFAINVSLTPHDNEISLTPKDAFKLNYEFSIDKFQSNPYTTLGDLTAGTAVTLNSGTAAGNSLIPYNFVADSSLITHGLRFSRPFGDTAMVAAGYSNSQLKQDNYTSIQVNNGYSGQNTTDSGYVTGKLNVARTVGLEAFYRFNNRNNDSTYPAGDLINPLTSAVSTYSYPRMVMPRINQLDVQTYGLEAQLYPSFLRTSWTVGWTHEDKFRDLTYATFAAIVPETSLYQDRSSSDEVALKMVARPAKSWILRVTPSYGWANKTGLVTEPEHMAQLKTQVSYSKLDWNELLVSGYYNIKRTTNGQHGYSDFNVVGAGTPGGTPGAVQTGAFGELQYQNVDKTLQSAGLNVSLVPLEEVKVNFGYAWNQTDFSTNYFSTNRVRYHSLYVPNNTPFNLTSLDFLILDNTQYKVNTHTLNAGGEWQWQDFTFSGAYSLTYSLGDNATGLAGQTLPVVDASVNNLLHSLGLGGDYKLKENLLIKCSYNYDNYKDMVYPELSGDMHTLMLGLTYRN